VCGFFETLVGFFSECVGQRIGTAVRIRSELADMSPEGESIKPDDEDVDTEDLGFDKTEGDETSPEEK